MLWRCLLAILLFSFVLPARAADVLMQPLEPELGQSRLSLVLYSAPHPIDWSTPGAMVRAVIWNTLTGDSSPISHVDVALRCAGQRPQWSGMARTKTWGQIAEILLGGKSLEMLTQAYPGYLLSEEQILRELHAGLEQNRVRALTIQISDHSCARVSRYLAEYKARGFTATYAGFTANPFRGEGAGCAAYAMSALKVAGILSADWVEAWTRRLRIPEHLMNQGAKHSASSGFWSFFFGRNEHWATASEPAVPITVFDPERIFNWVAKREMRVDRSQWPTPTQDFWAYDWNY